MIKVEKLGGKFYRVNDKKVAIVGTTVDPDNLLTHSEKQALTSFVRAEQRGLKIYSTTSTPVLVID
jgi:hypothetical protein